MPDLDKIFGPNNNVSHNEINSSFLILGIGILIFGIYLGKKITKERKKINNLTKKWYFNCDKYHVLYKVLYLFL